MGTGAICTPSSSWDIVTDTCDEHHTHHSLKIVYNGQNLLKRDENVSVTTDTMNLRYFMHCLFGSNGVLISHSPLVVKQAKHRDEFLEDYYGLHLILSMNLKLIVLTEISMGFFSRLDSPTQFSPAQKR